MSKTSKKPERNSNADDRLPYRYECADALDFMKALDDNSVQLIVTSPPYNIGKEYETKTSLEAYLKTMEPMIEQMCRITAETGSICWQVGNYVKDGEVYPLDIFFYDLFKKNGMKLRNRIIWHFGHGLHCKNRFSGRYETILWFTKTDHYVFNLDDVRIPSKYPGKKYFKGEKQGQFSGNPKGKNPEDVWELTVKRLEDDWDSLIWDVPNVKNNHPEKENHPCQFPIELVERCVLALTNIDDIVYDPFAGVGSSLIAALKNGRTAFGTELEQQYLDIGERRIQELKKGVLPYRPIYQEIYKPKPGDKITQRPKEWGVS